MKVIKNINNNVSVCLDGDGYEVVVFGSGVGFVKPPSEIPLEKIQRTFYDINPNYLNVISQLDGLEKMRVLYGKDCLEAVHVKDIFEEKHIELIPSIFASCHPGGLLEREAFDFIEGKILRTIREHLGELDGIYLQLHGASAVKGLDCVSGEHHIVRRIREIVGEHMPMAMVMDPHGNVTKELCGQVNIIRCYRESPHRDQIETERLVAEKLIDLLENRRPMKPMIRKLPIMVGGERSVSAREPISTINRMLDEAEQDSRVFSASYHVGYIRHDDDKLGAAVVVVPNMPEDEAYCGKVAEEIGRYAWDHRKEFQFGGNYDEVEAAVARTIAYPGKTAVITDSGDNCGAGGAGHNTLLLRELLRVPSEKKVLVAGIHDPKAHEYLSRRKLQDRVSFSLGVHADENFSPVEIEGTLIQIGDQMYGLGGGFVVGLAYTVHIDGTNIDCIVVDHNIQYGNMEQFHAAGLEFHDYDIVVVKMGYLDTFLIPETAYHMMALSDGPTVQRSERIPFKKIYRPMWPMDEAEELRYIEK